MGVTASDHWIAMRGGKLFARAWIPPDLSRATDASILLFHDSLGCVDLWRDFPGKLALATQRSVVAYDRLGFGKSDVPPGPLSLAFIRDEAAVVVPRLCDALGLDAIIPFGHSVGGAMAIATAAHLPERCAAVVTESVQTFVEDRTLSGIRAAQADFNSPGQIERLVRYHGAKTPWVLEAWIDTWLDAGFADWSLDDDLRKVHCPTLAIHGDRDEYGSLEHPERIARMTRGPSRVVIFDNCGHVPHREQPERVLGEVASFLRSATSALFAVFTDLPRQKKPDKCCPGDELSC